MGGAGLMPGPGGSEPGMAEKTNRQATFDSSAHLISDISPELGEEATSSMLHALVASWLPSAAQVR